MKSFLLSITVVLSKQSTIRRLAPVKSGKYTLRHLPSSNVSNDIYGAQKKKEILQMECSENGEDPDVPNNTHGMVTCQYLRIIFQLISNILDNKQITSYRVHWFRR